MSETPSATPNAPHNATANDLTAYLAGYDAWLAANRPQMEAGEFGPTFKTYPHVTHATAPFAKLQKPLHECTLALVSTAGLYLKGSQQPFDADNIEGDSSLRTLPTGTPHQAMAIAHTHYNHASAEADRESVYPITRLEELVAAGKIGRLASNQFSVSGYCTRADQMAGETAPEIVAALKAEGVDAVLLVPV